MSEILGYTVNEIGDVRLSKKPEYLDVLSLWHEDINIANVYSLEKIQSHFYSKNPDYFIYNTVMRTFLKNNQIIKLDEIPEMIKTIKLNHPESWI